MVVHVFVVYWCSSAYEHILPTCPTGWCDTSDVHLWVSLALVAPLNSTYCFGQAGPKGHSGWVSPYSCSRRLMGRCICICASRVAGTFSYTQLGWKGVWKGAVTYLYKQVKRGHVCCVSLLMPTCGRSMKCTISLGWLDVSLLCLLYKLCWCHSLHLHDTLITNYCLNPTVTGHLECM